MASVCNDILRDVGFYFTETEYINIAVARELDLPRKSRNLHFGTIATKAIHFVRTTRFLKKEKGNSLKRKYTRE